MIFSKLPKQSKNGDFCHAKHHILMNFMKIQTVIWDEDIVRPEIENLEMYFKDQDPLSFARDELMDMEILEKTSLITLWIPKGHVRRMLFTDIPRKPSNPMTAGYNSEDWE